MPDLNDLIQKIAAHNYRPPPELITECREALHMNKIEFGKALGVSQSLPYKWETGECGISQQAGKSIGRMLLIEDAKRAFGVGEDSNE